MHIAHQNQELKSYVSEAKKKGRRIGFVPTMGALHEGHLKLIHEAQKHCDCVVVSIFVNPRQFNNAEDLKKYPRTLENDIQKLEAENVDLLYAPKEEDIYPKDLSIPPIQLGQLEKVLEGKFRPGHFDGVAQVVYRLFELVQPHQAFFGLKDLQQVAVIKAMVAQLDLSVQIVEVPISREENGLARSSRNVRLGEQGKQDALVLYQTLKATQDKALDLDGNWQEIEQFANDYFDAHAQGLEKEYIALVDADTFEPPSSVTEKDRIYLCIAAWCNKVRLIDNVQLFH